MSRSVTTPPRSRQRCRRLLRWRSQDGSTAVEFVAGVGVLLLPVVLLVASLPGWAEYASAARVAAQEAARILAVEGPEAASAADAVARQVGQNHRASVEITEVGWELRRAGVDTPPQEYVVVTVDVEMPALPLPFVEGFGGFRYTATHAEALDVYRSRG